MYYICMYVCNYASINGLPQDGRGGQPPGSLTFLRWKFQIPLPWVLSRSQILIQTFVISANKLVFYSQKSAPREQA